MRNEPEALKSVYADIARTYGGELPRLLEKLRAAGEFYAQFADGIEAVSAESVRATPDLALAA